eukprot:6273057-Lingulodinium_polyedra.AAC.1
MPIRRLPLAICGNLTFVRIIQVAGLSRAYGAEAVAPRVGVVVVARVRSLERRRDLSDARARAGAGGEVAVNCSVVVATGLSHWLHHCP